MKLQLKKKRKNVIGKTIEIITTTNGAVIYLKNNKDVNILEASDIRILESYEALTSK